MTTRVVHRAIFCALVIFGCSLFFQASPGYSVSDDERLHLNIGHNHRIGYGALDQTASDDNTDSDDSSFITRGISCIYDSLSRCFKKCRPSGTIFNYEPEDLISEEQQIVEPMQVDLEAQLGLNLDIDGDSDTEVTERFNELMKLPAVSDLFIDPKSKSCCAKTGRCFFNVMIFLSKAPEKVRQLGDKALEYKAGRAVKNVFVYSIWFANKIVMIDVIAHGIDYIYHKGWFTKFPACLVTKGLVIGKSVVDFAIAPGYMTFATCIFKAAGSNLSLVSKGLVKYVFVPRSMTVTEGAVKVALSKALTTTSQKRKYLKIHDAMAQILSTMDISDLPETPVELLATALNPVIFKKATKALHHQAVVHTPEATNILESEISSYFLHCMLYDYFFQNVLLPNCVFNGEHPAEWVETTLDTSYKVIYYPNYIKLAYKFGGIKISDKELKNVSYEFARDFLAKKFVGVDGVDAEKFIAMGINHIDDIYEGIDMGAEMVRLLRYGRAQTLIRSRIPRIVGSLMLPGIQQPEDYDADDEH